MRILYLRTQFEFGLKAGGSVGHTSGVINALSKQHSVDVVTNDYLVEVAVPQRIIKPKTYRFPRNFNENLYSFQLFKTLKNETPPDFIYHRFAGDSFVAAKLAKHWNVPLILEYNASAIWELSNWKSNQGLIKNTLTDLFRKWVRIPLTKKVEFENLNTASIIVVVSDELKNILIRMGIEAEKVLVYPNGIDPIKFNPSIQGNKILEKHNLLPYKIAGFIGSFGHWHGVEVMAHAINVFYKKYPHHVSSVRFLLIGDGVLMPNVKQILSEDSYNQLVTLTGTIPQEEAPHYLAACDILLSPHVENPDGTKFFGSPTKLFEYMAMGKAIIASNLHQIGQILTNNETGLLTPSGDPEAIADALNYLFENPEKRISLGENASKSVIANYTWDKHVAVILDAFSKLNHN